MYAKVINDHLFLRVLGDNNAVIDFISIHKQPDGQEKKEWPDK